MITTKKLISSIRKSSGLNQKEFATLFKTSASRISAYERGLESIGFNKAMEICEHFEISLNQLLCNGTCEACKCKLQ